MLRRHDYYHSRYVCSTSKRLTTYHSRLRGDLSPATLTMPAVLNPAAHLSTNIPVLRESVPDTTCLQNTTECSFLDTFGDSLLQCTQKGQAPCHAAVVDVDQLDFCGPQQRAALFF